MPFAPGESGNPAGRAFGSRNRKTLLMEALLEGDGENLTQRLIQKAMSGDATALRLCVDRLIAPRRDRPVPIPLPPLRSAKDVGASVAEIHAGMGAGTVTPREALELLRALDKMAATLKATEADSAAAAEQKPERLRFSWADGTHVADMVRQPDGTYRSLPRPDKAREE